MPNWVPLQPFRRWVTEPSQGPLPPQPQLQLLAPVWLVASQSTCWKCRVDTAVFCLASGAVQEAGTENVLVDALDGDMVFISELSAIDARIEPLLRSAAPGYAPGHSSIHRAQRWMNHCAHCGSRLEDFLLHEEPGSAFVPTTPAKWSLLRPGALLRHGTYRFCGSYAVRS